MTVVWMMCLWTWGDAGQWTAAAGGNCGWWHETNWDLTHPINPKLWPWPQALLTPSLTLTLITLTLWLVSRVVSMLDSRAEGPGFKSQPQRCRVTVLKQTVYTHCASVHQLAKLVAALLRAARVTAGLAESNGSLPSSLWLTSPAGWLPRTRIISRTLLLLIEYGLPF